MSNTLELMLCVVINSAGIAVSEEQELSFSVQIHLV